MKNTKRMRSILFVSLVAVWGSVFYEVAVMIGKHNEQGPADGEFVNASPSDVHFYRYAADVRDPFRFIDRVRKRTVGAKRIDSTREYKWEPPPYSLDGVVTDGLRRLAVIRLPGGEVAFLSEGDTLNGIRIRKIDGDSVFYWYTGRSGRWGVK